MQGIDLYYSIIKSTDFCLCVQDRSNAQVSCAGLFIMSHLGQDYQGAWLHIDMATPAASVSFFSILIKL